MAFGRVRVPMAKSERARKRLLLGAAWVGSPSEAAALAPGADHKAMQYFREHGLIRTLGGKPVVIWGDVLDAIRKGELAR